PRELTVIAIPGEGDRTAAALATLSDSELRDTAKVARAKAEIKPDVVVVLRDDSSTIELRLADWDEVDQLKAIAGYDTERRHWRHDASVKIAIGPEPAPAA